MSKHTPGPWEVNDDCHEDRPEVIGSTGDKPLICSLNDIHPEVGACGCGGDPKANARLIAAAPDLLAACRAAMLYIPGSEVRNWPPGFKLKDNAIGMICEAIAKAEGK